MLINRRNAMMAGKRLPYDAEVEWLEGDDTRWIDTGFTALGASTIDCTFIAPYDTKNKHSCVAYGARTGYGVRECHAERSDITGGFYVRRNVNAPTAEWVTRSNPPLSSTIRSIVSPDNVIVEVDGNVVLSGVSAGSWTRSKTVFDLQYSLTLFKANNTTWSLYPTKILEFKIVQDNGEPVMELRPVRKSGIGYMYDVVSGMLLGVSGSGTLGIGPDKVSGAFVAGPDASAAMVVVGGV